MSLRNMPVNTAGHSPGNKTRHPNLSPSPQPNDFLDDASWPNLTLLTLDAFQRRLNGFMQLFISTTIEYRCGQLAEAAYLDGFLCHWVEAAQRRSILLNTFFEINRGTLLEVDYTKMRAVRERFQAVVRDALEELGRHGKSVKRTKNISFAHPIAKRLVFNRSLDRMSLYTISDGERSRSSVPSSVSPTPQDESEAPLSEGPDQADLSPPPKARTSGVYYGDVMRSLPLSPSAPQPAAPAAEAPDVIQDMRQMLEDFEWRSRRRANQKKMMLFFVYVFVFPITFLAICSALGVRLI